MGENAHGMKGEGIETEKFIDYGIDGKLNGAEIIGSFPSAFHRLGGKKFIDSKILYIVVIGNEIGIIPK